MTLASLDSVESWSPFAGVIYGVSERGSSKVRYVGLTTKTISRRRSQHFRNIDRGRRTPFGDWLSRFPNPESVFFDSLELVMSDSLEHLGAAEQRWIARLRDEGHRLLNLTDGGLGPRGYVWTPEQRQMVSDRFRGTTHPNPLRGPENPMWGRSHSEAQKDRWSAQRKGQNTGALNPNFGKFGTEHPAFGRRMSPESRAALSEMRLGEMNPNFGKSASAETRAKMSAARRGVPKPSSKRSAHTRYHTNKAVFTGTCQHCIDDLQAKKSGEETP